MSNARNIGDSAPVINFLDNVTSDIQTQLNTLDTAIGNVSVTSGSLTKTFAADETATVTLTGNVLAPVVTATKEVAQTGVTNNDWDAAAASYTLENSAPSTTLDFVGYDVSGASFVDSFSISAQETEPEGIAFNTDGTKMYVIGTTGDDVNEYTLSTGFDVSTATYSQNFDVSSQETEPKGIAFNADGTRMFVVGDYNNAVFEYQLTTGFDVSTASYTDSFSVSAQESSPQDVAFNTDGTKMFILGNTGVDVNEYTLSTGFDVSTASYSQNFSISGQESYPRGLTFNTDGTKMFVVGNSADKVSEYALSTGFDVSTASYSQNFDVGAQDTVPRGIAFNASGTKMFILGSTGDDVNEYTIAPSSVTLGTGSFASGDVGKTIEANSGKLVLTSTGGAVTVTTTPSSYAQVASGSWQMYALVYDSTADVLKPSQYILGYQVTSAAYDSNTVNINAKSSSGEGLYVKPDGSKFYVIDSTYDKVFEYDMSTPDDLTTASFVGEVSVASEEINPKGVFFKPDGLSMYIIGLVNPTTSLQDIRQYTLSTAWDVSTATYSSKYIYVGGSDTEPQDLWISSDGTLVFWIGTQSKGGTTGRLYKWTMSTAWDISTAVATQSINIHGYETSPRGIALAADGKSFYTIGTQYDAITGWYLSTAFDLSTVGAGTAAGYLSTSAQDGEPRALAFNGDGSKLFTSGTSNTSIFRYSTGSSSTATGYQPAIASTIDSTYWTDLNSMTATNAVGDGNVFYAISADAKTSWNILDNSSGVRKIVKNNGGTYQVNTNSTYGSETWANAATNTEVAALREAMTSASSVSGQYDLSTATLVDSFTGINSQDTSPYGLCFSATGHKMYISGITQKAIFEYDLSTNFDVSTASYTANYGVVAQDNSPNAVEFNNDGTKMYVAGDQNDSIYEYALSTAWSVTSATLSSTFSIATYGTDPWGIAFNSDGTLMFTIVLNGTVLVWALSTGFDISTASYSTNYSGTQSQLTYATGIDFKPDGTKMFVVDNGGQDVLTYTLTTGFDVSTASFSHRCEINRGGTVQAKLNNDGTKLFVLNYSYYDVEEYAVGTTDYVNQMTSTELAAINDASQITLGTALDLAAILYYTSGSSVPTYSGTAINYDANVINQGAILGTDYTYDAPAQNKVRITSVNAANLKIRVV